MKIKNFRLALAIYLIALFALVGCGGGGGGGSVTGPIVTVPDIPADAAFAVPTGYSSAAFPKSTPAVNLTLSAFNAGSVANVYLMNFAASAQSPSWSVTGPAFAATKRSAVVASKTDTRPASPEHLFHLQLRQKARLMTPPAVAADSAVRASLRPAVGVGSTDTFMAYVTGSTVPVAIAATCKKSDAIVGVPKKVHFFVDNADTGMTNLNKLLEDMGSYWAAIYVKNRAIFGAEPEGLLTNGVDATDFYVFLSRRVYTAGYFYTGDLNSIAQTADSNQKKMFNLQLPSSISTGAGINNIDIVTRELSATMAHEFQHMIHYWQRGSSSDTWLEEAMSGYAEYANGFKIENGFNQSKALQTNRYFSLINQITVNKWHAASDSDNVVNAYYGKAYLFGVWLAQNYGSSGSVQSLLTQQVDDMNAVEVFAGQSFEEVFSKFMMAMSVNDYTNGGFYGFKDLDLTASYNFAGLASVQLTGPLQTEVTATEGGSDNSQIAPYAAAYIRIGSGDGKDINISATLPQYSALYQLRKN